MRSQTPLIDSEQKDQSWRANHPKGDRCFITREDAVSDLPESRRHPMWNFAGNDGIDGGKHEGRAAADQHVSARPRQTRSLSAPRYTLNKDAAMAAIEAEVQPMIQPGPKPASAFVDFGILHTKPAVDTPTNRERCFCCITHHVQSTATSCRPAF